MPTKMPELQTHAFPPSAPACPGPETPPRWQGIEAPKHSGSTSICMIPPITQKAGY